MDAPVGSHFSDRCEQFIKKQMRADDVARVRHRHEAIIAHSRDLFRDARVLDLMSSSGFWSLAALDAGAAHVTGLESSKRAVEAAQAAFAELPVDSASYRFVNAKIAEALRAVEPRTVDLVLCHGFLERSDPRFFFQQMARLKVKYVILDTRIVRGQGPIVRFALSSGDTPGGRYRNIMSFPNHDLISFMCDYFQFRWQLVQWQAMSIPDWTSVMDYKNDRRRTYVLENSAA
jgi:16S rRNA G966 N2-methylase RsmD